MEGHIVAEKKALRLQEWRDWISNYLVDKGDTITLIPNAAELLNDYYWKLALIYVKPLLQGPDEKEHNLHYYKIISASEITVMAVMPLVVAGGDGELFDIKRKKHNADFALFVALSILTNWEINGKALIDEEKLSYILETREAIATEGNETTFYPQTLMDEHVAWLVALNTAAALPVMSNGQTWRAIFLSSKFQ